MGDQFFKYKYALRMTAAQAGKTVTFMPKPLFGDNGSGMHVHQSLWKNGEPIFYDANGYGELSKIAMHYAAGLLAHAPALAGITNPTVNSYRRLVPGYEAPVNLIISARNRSAVVRVPMYFTGPEARKSKRLEYRAPDASTNAYLAFAAMLMAGLDGVQRELEPPAPIDKNLYHLPARQRRRRSNSCRRAWTKRWMPWKPTMTSCSRATSSPKTCSNPGWNSSAANPIRPACAPHRSSITCTTISDCQAVID